MQKFNRTKGNWAESVAKFFLIDQGMELIAEQFKTKCGEIDLVMKLPDKIIYVEVRSLDRLSLIRPLETIDRYKQKKLIQTALLFQQRNLWSHAFCHRFDVIELIGTKANYKITWIENAFGVE